MVYVARIGRLLYIHFHAHRCVEGRQREPHSYYNEIGSRLMYPQVKISFCASITRFKVEQIFYYFIIDTESSIFRKEKI